MLEKRLVEMINHSKLLNNYASIYIKTLPLGGVFLFISLEFIKFIKNIVSNLALIICNFVIEKEYY